MNKTLITAAALFALAFIGSIVGMAATRAPAGSIAADTVYVGSPAPDTVYAIEMRRTADGRWIDADTTVFIAIR